MRDQARSKLCFHFISGVARADRPADELAEERLARAAAIQTATNGRIPIPFDGDSKSERRLATLLWRWTDQKVDWMAFLQCDDNATDIGSQMWNVIMQRYQLRTATEVDEHFQRLRRKQGNNEKIQDWWVCLTSA